MARTKITDLKVRRRAAGSPRSGEKKTPNQEDLRKLMLAMNPDAEQIEEAVAAAPRVPETASRLGKGFYEANVEPLLSPIETARSLIDLGKEFVTSPAETGKTIARTELERLQQAGRSPEAAAGYLGGMLSPFSLFRQLPARREITAYHGSPTQFEPTAESMLGEFDVTKAGRGVGQQNRGPGTYIAENPKVANRYRIATGSANPKKGFMYTVDLPDPMIEKMIDLDAPIVNQPKIRETLLKIADDGVLPPESANYLRYMLTNPDRELQKYPLTGQGLIAVPRELGGIFKDVTEANTILQQYGIPGSRWKDDVSRGPNKGTRNFVVFPGEEKKVKILEREGPEGERTTAAPVGRTPQAPPVYHVTQTKYLPNIKKKGLLPLQTSNWVKASNRERYGGGDVYAFSTREDAERWAAKMDWAFNQKIGSGKISIVTVNRPENVKFDIDQNDPISQISNAGPWLKTSERIPAKNIVSAEEFTKDTAPGFFGNVVGKATDGE